MKNKLEQLKYALITYEVLSKGGDTFEISAWNNFMHTVKSIDKGRYYEG